ncbi:uncharacterized protein [Euwallacea similis]|uniref:uncharacterized protein n=1 Tax=Euwallacea similis TaxID=1736056 RepID=UPI00344C932B
MQSSVESTFTIGLMVLFISSSKTTAQNISETTAISLIIEEPAGTSSPPIPYTTRKPFLPAFRLPCSCSTGQCGCCTGYILDRLNQKACVNMTYEPEEFAVNAVMTLNDVPFFDRTFSGKNPPPICIRLPRIPFVKFCVEFSNVYFNNRNVHMCIDAEANWEDFTLIEWSFDCLRMGASGFHVIRPEDGGGLPESPIDSEGQTDEDYDDSARSTKSTREEPKIVFHKSFKRISGKCCDSDLVSVKSAKNGDVLVFSSEYVVNQLKHTVD